MFFLLSPVADASPDFVTAIWKEQSFDFAYSGSTTRYSCSSLQRRVQDILQVVGARGTPTVVLRDCVDLLDARLQITVTSPVEATDENVLAATQHDSTALLAARVRNETLPTASTLQRFPATWEAVSLSQEKSLQLDAGDCELVKQLNRDVFPRMAIRVVKENLRCSRGIATASRPQLSVVALMAAPRVD